MRKPPPARKTLTDIDNARFAWKADGHFQSHFGIVGFTTPSPVRDGKHVWVWCGNGVAACYDLDGKRQWITRLITNELSYSSAPALADGTFAVIQPSSCGRTRYLPARDDGSGPRTTGGGHVKGNQVQASELLVISRTTLRAKLRSLGITFKKQLLSRESEELG